MTVTEGSGQTRAFTNIYDLRYGYVTAKAGPYAGRVFYYDDDEDIGVEGAENEGELRKSDPEEDRIIVYPFDLGGTYLVEPRRYFRMSSVGEVMMHEAVSGLKESRIKPRPVSDDISVVREWAQGLYPLYVPGDEVLAKIDGRLRSVKVTAVDAREALYIFQVDGSDTRLPWEDVELINLEPPDYSDDALFDEDEGDDVEGDDVEGEGDDASLDWIDDFCVLLEEAYSNSSDLSYTCDENVNGVWEFEVQPLKSATVVDVAYVRDQITNPVESRMENGVTSITGDYEGNAVLVLLHTKPVMTN